MTCQNCAILRDEVVVARAAVAEFDGSVGYIEFHPAVEFARIWEDPSGDRLYVHCVPAWGETDPEFQARYKRVRDTLVKQQRLAPRAPEPEVVAPARHDVTHLFTGRLDDGS